MDLISADLLGAELIRWAAEMQSVLRRGTDVRWLRTWRKITYLHVIQHALTKRIHSDSFRLHSRPNESRTESAGRRLRQDLARSAYRRRRFRSTVEMCS